MKNPLLEMKRALKLYADPKSYSETGTVQKVDVEKGMITIAKFDVGQQLLYREDEGDLARKALSALESSGWNLDAIPELVEACELLCEQYASSGVTLQVAKALAKLKERK